MSKLDTNLLCSLDKLSLIHISCRNGKKLGVDHIRHSKSKTGYVSEKTIYKCEDCNGCPYKSECIKGNNCKTPLEERTKTLQVAKTFLKHRKEDLDRILSEEWILFRTNRSIQAEGSFGAVSYTHLDVYKRQQCFRASMPEPNIPKVNITNSMMQRR